MWEPYSECAGEERRGEEEEASRGMSAAAESDESRDGQGGMSSQSRAWRLFSLCQAKEANGRKQRSELRGGGRLQSSSLATSPATTTPTQPPRLHSPLLPAPCSSLPSPHLAHSSIIIMSSRNNSLAAADAASNDAAAAAAVVAVVAPAPNAMAAACASAVPAKPLTPQEQEERDIRMATQRSMEESDYDDDSMHLESRDQFGNILQGGASAASAASSSTYRKSAAAAQRGGGSANAASSARMSAESKGATSPDDDDADVVDLTAQRSQSAQSASRRSSSASSSSADDAAAKAAKAAWQQARARVQYPLISSKPNKLAQLSGLDKALGLLIIYNPCSGRSRVPPEEPEGAVLLDHAVSVTCAPTCNARAAVQ